MTGRVLLLLAFAAVALTCMAAPSSAHAELVASSPAPQSQQAQAPASVVLRFSAPVEVSSAAIRVFDQRARRVDGAAVRSLSAEASAISVRLRDGLGDGTYTTSWRVTAVDGHPLQG